MSIHIGGGVDQERCIPISRRTRIILEATGIQQMDILMNVRVQQMRDKLVAVCTWYSGDDLGIEAIHPS